MAVSFTASGMVTVTVEVYQHVARHFGRYVPVSESLVVAAKLWFHGYLSGKLGLAAGQSHLL